MSVRHYKNKRERRHLRVRGKVKGTAERPRLSVFRSNRYIYVQLIDDEKGVTLAAASVEDTENPSGRTEFATGHGAEEYAENAEKRLPGKVEAAHRVGRVLAEKALKLGIKTVVFDRGGYKYHGRVKALAEGAREGGLKF